MFCSELETSVDAAYWFLDKADEDRLDIDEAKVQHLVFLAQFLYAEVYEKSMLMPSLFICCDEGIYEPNLKRILAQGRPFIPRTPFRPKTENFFNGIWKKYAGSSSRELEYLIKGSDIYLKNHVKGAKIVLDFKSVVESLNKNSKISGNRDECRKILQSQNGPVVVSKWHPKKVSDFTSHNRG